MASLLFLAPDLSANSVYPPWQFAGALSGTHRTTLAGPASGAPWFPLAEELAEAVRLCGSVPSARAVMEALRARVPDVVWPFKAHPASFGVALRLRDRLGIPLLLHLDDWDAGYFAGVPRGRRAWYALRSLFLPDGEIRLRAMEQRVRDADAVTVSTRALLRRFGGTLVCQGVDTDRFSPERYPRGEARRRFGLDDEVFLVLFLGTPRLHKGLAELADAVRALGSGVKLWIVGSPQRSEDLSVAGGDAVELHPSVSFHESGWYLAASDAFVVPQRDTPFARHQLPAKLVQGMALGVPIVASDVGDARELLGGETLAGLVVPPGDPEALVRALVRLRDEPELGASMARAARERAIRELGWDAMARVLKPVLEGVGVHA